MCAVSMMTQGWTTPSSPNYIPYQTYYSDPALAAQMLDVIKRLEEIDKKLGFLEHCKLEAKEKKSFKARLRRAAKRAAK